MTGRANSYSNSPALRTALRPNGPLACTEPAAAGERVARHPALSGAEGRGLPGPRHTGLPSRRQVEFGRSVEPGEIKRISNRHRCRLESRVNPSAPTTSFFLIVTKSRANLFAFSSHFSASPCLCGRNIPMCGPDALARDLRQSFTRRSRHSCLLISNRNIPGLGCLLNYSESARSIFLIATVSLLLRFGSPNFLRGLPPLPSRLKHEESPPTKSA